MIDLTNAEELENIEVLDQDEYGTLYSLKTGPGHDITVSVYVTEDEHEY